MFYHTDLVRIFCVRLVYFGKPRFTAEAEVVTSLTPEESDEMRWAVALIFSGAFANRWKNLENFFFEEILQCLWVIS